ncbi:MAG: hypothetical protein K9I85_01910 [Saprospiraceae bacterium]|nr:hypothetical protein [Saprospiraceae bacterium]
MKPLYRNIIFFTVGLALLTLSLETYRKGKLELDHPSTFFVAILILGMIGGYVITWVQKANHN